MSVTIQKFSEWKQLGRPIVALTAADYAIAQLLDTAGVDLILVGDSLGMVALGYNTTLPVTLEEMIHHAKAVRRGVKNAFVVVDLPFLSYQESPTQALQSAGKVIKESGAQGVKVEGGYPAMAETVERLVSAGIPVLGHVGLTPQSVHQLGLKKQGKTPEAAERILSEAIALEKAGAFGVVLEHIPAELAAQITQTLTIPSIGIGAGPHCDGQILVTHDLLGLSDRQPPFVKVYANLRQQAIAAIEQYGTEVRQGQFPEK